MLEIDRESPEEQLGGDHSKIFNQGFVSDVNLSQVNKRSQTYSYKVNPAEYLLIKPGLLVRQGDAIFTIFLQVTHNYEDGKTRANRSYEDCPFRKHVVDAFSIDAGDKQTISRESDGAQEDHL